MAVVKTEDRMGDCAELNLIKSETVSNDEDDDDDEEENCDDKADDEDEISDSDAQDYDDDEKDVDYVDSRTSYYDRSKVKKTMRNKMPEYETVSTSRAQRVRRVQIKIEEIIGKALKRTPAKAKTKAKQKQKNLTAIPKKKKLLRSFDYTKSERLRKQCYAFERLPITDLWYRVFTRQDNAAECYYEYFGSTNYRKLPYELGPIPLEKSLCTNAGCTLCCRKRIAAATTPDDNVAPKILTVKQEPAEIIEISNQMRPEQDVMCNNSVAESYNSAASPTNSSAAAASSSQYTHKHKKLHLLQRYRQEQQELLQQRQQEAPSEQLVEPKSVCSVTKSCDSKASTPDRDRAGSASSCASSSTTTLSKKPFRNKILQKAALLNMELPPRKSPREHASTLALVSCIIKQRQDSESKPNSEIDEPPSSSTPIPITAVGKVEESNNCLFDVPEVASRSPHNTRSAAATPVEELRFATEISENVKRLRRGQNKYDHSPPFVLNTAPPRISPALPTQPPRAKRGRPPKSATMGRVLPHCQPKPNISQPPLPQKRQRRQKYITTIRTKKHHSIGPTTMKTAQPSIRKTGSKKGVVEFEVDASALKTLDAAAKYTNMRQLEWDIDKYLELSCNDLDLNFDFCNQIPCEATEIVAQTMAANATQIHQTSTAQQSNESQLTIAPGCVNTPPPTDYFTSDFDLYDLIADTGHPNEHVSDVQHTHNGGTKRYFPNLYNSVALHNYFRRRKNLKSNRTGWPKVQKKKSSARQQQFLRQKIRFLQDIGIAQPPLIADEAAKEQTRETTVMTPPDSEIEENADNTKKLFLVEEDDAGDSIPDEDVETVGGVSIEEAEDEHEADEADDDDDEQDMEDEEEGDDGTAADVEAEPEDEEEEVEDDEDDDDEDEEPANKYIRHVSHLDISPAPIKQSHGLLPLNMGTATATSTPSAQLLRGLRRTPLLNGSLGSCISPSEKAGDNSDIFTVSSDGLDTDLDMSNSHSQHKGGDELHETHGHCRNHNHHLHHHHHLHNHQHQPTTPKRKFDLSNYAKSNATATSSCAAEAATAAVKSMAISQFLKKEVRVTCRRLRAPFRRFRYRR